MADRVKILYQDATPMGLVMGLSRNSRSAGVVDDEAGRIFASRLINDLGLFNKLWSGSTVSIDRRNDSFVVIAPRLTIAWMVQPAVYAKYHEKKGEEAKGIGFLARCLVSFPVSTQGTRFLMGGMTELTHINAFRDRVRELLEDQIKYFVPEGEGASMPSRVILSFSGPAQYEWAQTFNQVEQAIQPGGMFAQSRDYASKVAENIARVAGVLHAYEGYPGTEISLETLNSAASIVLWYAGEYVRLFSPPSPQDVITQHALILDQWLIEFVRSTNMEGISRTHLLQLGPNRLRSKNMLDVALQHLFNRGRAGYFAQQMNVNGNVSRKQTTMIWLNPAYYGQVARGLPPSGFFAPL